MGDVVIVKDGGGYSFDDVKRGDIIIFHTNDGGGRTICHRVVQIYSDSQTGERLLKTKGDSNPKSYENFDYPIRKQDYYGKVVFVVPKVGILSTILKQPARAVIVLVSSVLSR